MAMIQVGRQKLTAQSVVVQLAFHFNRKAIDRFTAALVSGQSEQRLKVELTLL